MVEAATLNVIQVSMAFFCILFAFDSASFIQQTVINTKHKQTGITKEAGYYSLAFVYGFYTISNFLAPPVINRLKARWSMAIAGLTYALFQASFLYLNEPALYLTSALMGLGSGVNWTAQGKYLALWSTPKNATKHASLFWGVSRGCLAFGGVFLYVMFHDAGKDMEIADSTIHVLYSITTIVTLIGVVLMATLRMPTDEQIQKSGKVVVLMSTKEILISTFSLLTTRRMQFLLFTFIYTGIELSFWSGIYPTCISFTHQLGHNTKSLIAFNAIAQGMGQGVAGLFFTFMSKQTRKIGRIRIVVAGFIIHICTFIAIYINFPSEAPLNDTDADGFIHPSITIAVVCAFLLGFGDACWNSQIYSYLVVRHNENCTEAFALFKFFQALLTSITFFYGSAIQLEWHMLILTITGILGVYGFIMAERISIALDESCEKASTIDSASIAP
uniref:UNC93-like protein MFSD11 n=1 Tax=Panagrellus redivivus TaxID=6233 RepID=A0A7E4VGL8_PANRE